LLSNAKAIAYVTQQLTMSTALRSSLLKCWVETTRPVSVRMRLCVP
jgi:hypothetical protein